VPDSLGSDFVERSLLGAPQARGEVLLMHSTASMRCMAQRKASILPVACLLEMRSLRRGASAQQSSEVTLIFNFSVDTLGRVEHGETDP
jgi:hypothetical protein